MLSWRNCQAFICSLKGIPRRSKICSTGFRTSLDSQSRLKLGSSVIGIQQAAVSIRSPQLNLPQFALRPQHLFHRIGEVFGYQDIDFDYHPQFSKNYLLRGNNEQQVRKLFTNEVLGFFESQDGVSTEGDGDQLIFYRALTRIKPEDVHLFREEGLRVFRLFKQ